jgi:hypothetical protein
MTDPKKQESSGQPTATSYMEQKLRARGVKNEPLGKNEAYLLSFENPKQMIMVPKPRS